MKWKLAYLGLLLSVLTACTYRKEKQIHGPSGAPLVQGSQSLTGPSFAYVQATIFIPKCVACHGQAGGVSLGGYQDVIHFLPRIERQALILQKMPPSGPLSSDLQDILREWIQDGAPVEGKPHPQAVPPSPTPGIPPANGTPTASPTPSPAPGATPVATPAPVIPLGPNFNSLKANIFSKKCMICHYAGGEIPDVLFDSKSVLVNSPRDDLVVPGDSEDSTLYHAVLKSMPPPTSGLGHLSPAEIAAIKDWIDKGATD